MSRRHRAEKRVVHPDPKFGDKTVSKFMNYVMVDGKKPAAEKIVYGAFDRIESKLKRPPVDLFKEALENVTPAIEVRSRRVGGATYQVPVEVRPDRKLALAQRDHHGRQAVERIDGRRAEPRRRREEARGHAPHGGSQPRLLALSLVTLFTRVKGSQRHDAHA